MTSVLDLVSISVLPKVIIHTESELNLFAVKERSQSHHLRHKANRKGKLKLGRTCHICTLVFYWCLFFPLFSPLKQLLSHDTSVDKMTLWILNYTNREPSNGKVMAHACQLVFCQLVTS